MSVVSIVVEQLLNSRSDVNPTVSGAMLVDLRFPAAVYYIQAELSANAIAFLVDLHPRYTRNMQKC